MQLRYRALIGTGGIGSGAFFALDGNHTLGREESRTGRFLDRRDYCKLHIVCHYVARLLGSGFSVIPIGRVGEDEAGRRLLGEMADVGLDLRYVARTAGSSTMYAFCLVYPDGSGGNLTTGDSASNEVDEEFVGQAAEEFARFSGSGIGVTLPEVPLAARRKLLRLGGEYGFLRAASFNSMELRQLRRSGELGARGSASDWLANIDLLALNLDEAAALSGLQPEQASPSDIVEATLAHLATQPRAVMVTITAGDQGSWSSDGATTTHIPAADVPVVSTAGAGDAHLAGTIVGLAIGLPLEQSQELGALVAAMSVTSPHTIHPGIDRESLAAFAAEHKVTVADPVRHFLQGAREPLDDKARTYDA